jgi:dolichol-phosphate mannosyltransferase
VVRDEQMCELAFVPELNNKTLAVIMPVYNEQASVRKVVQEWAFELDNWLNDFVIIAINDGSKDDSLKVLQRLKTELGNRLYIINRENRGHGQSCIEGYKIASDNNIPWVFQIDSDGQCDPQYFFRLWRKRDSNDVVYGVRTQRDDGFKRMLASMVLRMFILVLFRSWCWDANVPYRLMRSEKINKHLDIIPTNINLANIALSLLLRRDKNIRHGYISIRFRERYGGEPSVKMSIFGKKAIELYADISKVLKRG